MNPFEPFLDAEDLSACVDAEETPASLNARAEPLGCRFPLWLDPAQTLGDLFSNARATPLGFRYGSVPDNVLGLLWSLPNGARVRLGGRVVKNVTGFDLIRFLGAGRGRFGKPLRLVLRLRPLPETSMNVRLAGPWPGLKSLARAIRASSWVHVLDSCDLHAEPQKTAALWLDFGARADLLSHFRVQALTWAKEHDLVLAEPGPPPPPQAHPWARAQARLDDCVDLAREWVEAQGGGVHAFLGQGILQLQDPDAPARAEAALRDLHRRLGAQGGHCEHPALEDEASSPQARWQAELLRRLEAVA